MAPGGAPHGRQPTPTAACFCGIAPSFPATHGGPPPAGGGGGHAVWAYVRTCSSSTRGRNFRIFAPDEPHNRSPLFETTAAGTPSWQTDEFGPRAHYGQHALRAHVPGLAGGYLLTGSRLFNSYEAFIRIGTPW
ncbi:MAG: hypothetical protein ACLT5P_06020 [Flavonifractor plautii]